MRKKAVAVTRADTSYVPGPDARARQVTGGAGPKNVIAACRLAQPQGDTFSLKTRPVCHSAAAHNVRVVQGLRKEHVA